MSTKKTPKNKTKEPARGGKLQKRKNRQEFLAWLCHNVDLRVAMNNSYFSKVTEKGADPR